MLLEMETSAPPLVECLKSQSNKEKKNPFLVSVLEKCVYICIFHNIPVVLAEGDFGASSCEILAIVSIGEHSTSVILFVEIATLTKKNRTTKGQIAGPTTATFSGSCLSIIPTAAHRSYSLGAAAMPVDHSRPSMATTSADRFLPFLF